MVIVLLTIRAVPQREHPATAFALSAPARGQAGPWHLHIEQTDSRVTD